MVTGLVVDKNLTKPEITLLLHMKLSRAAAKHTTVAERKCTTTGAELLFEVFSQRYERGSILVTTNLP